MSWISKGKIRRENFKGRWDLWTSLTAWCGVRIIKHQNNILTYDIISYTLIYKILTEKGVTTIFVVLGDLTSFSKYFWCHILIYVSTKLFTEICLYWDIQHSNSQLYLQSNMTENLLQPLINSFMTEQRLLSYRNQSIDLRSKSLDWFLYDNGLRHEKVKNDWWDDITPNRVNNIDTYTKGTRHI